MLCNTQLLQNVQACTRAVSLFHLAHSTDIDCPKSKETAMISSVSWPKLKITSHNSRQVLRISEKSIRLIACIAD